MSWWPRLRERMFEPPTVRIAGVRWRAIQTRTLALEFSLENLLLRSGLTRSGRRLQTGQNADEFARQVWRRLQKKGHLLLILGHLVMPQAVPDREWSLELAQQTARALGSATSESDKAIIQAVVAQFIVNFLTASLPPPANPAVLHTSANSATVGGRP